MHRFSDELYCKIFRLIDTPISLVLTNRKWYNIAQYPHTRAEWLIYKYGRSHALFHAVRLGSGFITVDIVQALLAKNAIISRYFIQRLLMYFGAPDELLDELKNKYNVNQNNVDVFRSYQKKSPCSWASKLPLPIFNKLIIVGFNIFKDLPIKGNDMELFHYLSAGPFIINDAPQTLFQNLKHIEDLILNQKFIPSPPRPNPIYEDTKEYMQLMQERTHESYPPRDGFENSRQLDVMARAILIHPDLVNLWKQIGYYEVCNDINELVIQGALLILFPPILPANWECPTVNSVVVRLKQLINLGFQLTETAMEEAFYVFEHKLNNIGNILMSTFQEIHEKSVSEIACSCLIQTIKLERKHRKFDLLEFLIDWIDKPEEALYNALEYYNVGFKFDVDSIKTTEKIRSLSVQSNVYYWILKKFGPNSKVTQKCFEDIIESRIWIDLKLQKTPGREIPEHLTYLAFNSICSIYLEFCNERISFKTNYLPYLQQANDKEILKPFFEINLPISFGLQLKCELPFVINYGYNRPKVISTQRKLNELNDQPDDNEREEWIKSLEIYDQIPGVSGVSGNFKVYIENFLDEIFNLE